MLTQELLNLLTATAQQDPIFEVDDFITFLRSPAITTSSDPFVRLVHAALQAGSHATAGIAGHQSAIRRLFPSAPTDAVTSFCVSEARGPHPRYIETQLSHQDGHWQITGEKMWGTMAPPATVIYVAASTGVVDGQNQLQMVGVDATATGITQLPLPPERQAGEMPICDLKFSATPVAEDQLFSGDAYEAFIKPFRLIEDVFSTVATQIALLRLGTQAGLDHGQQEQLIGLIVQGHAIAESTMDAPGDILLITTYLRDSQAFWNTLADAFVSAAPEVQSAWDVSRPILTVAARARAQRRSNAWQALEQPLGSQ